MEVPMKRFAFVMAGLALAWVATGCSDGGNNNPRPDLRQVFDIAMPPQDLTMLAQTGDPCTASMECAPSLSGPSTRPVCTKTSSFPNAANVPWTGGYCQSPCLSRNVDSNG